MKEYTVLTTGFTAKNDRLETKQFIYTCLPGDIYDKIRSDYPAPAGGVCNFTVWFNKECVAAGSYN
jgi:hypothetical protein